MRKYSSDKTLSTLQHKDKTNVRSNFFAFCFFSIQFMQRNWFRIFRSCIFQSCIFSRPGNRCGVKEVKKRMLAELITARCVFTLVIITRVTVIIASLITSSHRVTCVNSARMKAALRANIVSLSAAHASASTRAYRAGPDCSQHMLQYKGSTYCTDLESS